MLRQLLRSRKGQGLVEYALLVAGVALACIVGVSLMGEKTADMIAAVATVLPGSGAADNGPIAVGHLLETTPATNGPIGIDVQTIASKAGQARLGGNFAGTGDMFGGLIQDPIEPTSGSGS